MTRKHQHQTSVLVCVPLVQSNKQSTVVKVCNAGAFENVRIFLQQFLCHGTLDPFEHQALSRCSKDGSWVFHHRVVFYPTAKLSSDKANFFLQYLSGVVCTALYLTHIPIKSLFDFGSKCTKLVADQMIALAPEKNCWIKFRGCRSTMRQHDIGFLFQMFTRPNLSATN